MRITDTALEKVVAEIALRQPEEGGALLGLRGSSLVVDFLHDHDAERSFAYFLNSPKLAERVREKETACPALDFCGVIHSHPPFIDRLSGPDHTAAAELFRLNPGRRLFFPIITKASVHEGQLNLGDQVMVGFEALFNGIRPVEILLIPLGAQLRALEDYLEVPLTVTWELVSADRTAIAIRFKRNRKSYLLLLDGNYPDTAPTGFQTDSQGELAPMSFRWDSRSAFKDRAITNAINLKGKKP